jgi:hypothetical protein
MQKIPLKNATAGMKLAKSIKNKRGMPLCTADTELNENMISRLSDAGITEVTVKGNPFGEDASVKPLRQQIDELNARFSSVEQDPLMKRIKSIIFTCLNERVKESDC